MKVLVISLHLLILLACTSTLYGTLESVANMIEQILIPFTTDPTTAGALVFGGVFLILVAAASTVLYVGAPMLASAVVACISGFALRHYGLHFSRAAGRALVVIALGCNLAYVLAAEPSDFFFRGRPRVHPRTPVLALACIAGANAALSAFVTALILRKFAPGIQAPARPHGTSGP